MTFEMLSETMYVLSGWNVIKSDGPMLNPGKKRRGINCGVEGKPSVIIPRPFELSNPRDASEAKPPLGVLAWVDVRKKVARASFTAVGPRVFVLLITNSCARVGETVGKPGALETPKACESVESSKW